MYDLLWNRGKLFYHMVFFGCLQTFFYLKFLQWRWQRKGHFKGMWDWNCISNALIKGSMHGGKGPEIKASKRIPFLYSVLNMTLKNWSTQASGSLETENMRKRQRGTTKRAESFRKSSVSLEMTPILDQSPLYLNMESCIFIYAHEKLIIYKEEEEEKDKGDGGSTRHRWIPVQALQWQSGQGLCLKLSKAGWIVVVGCLNS